MKEHIIITLSKAFPQLCLPLGYDVKDSDIYKRSVLRGAGVNTLPDFSFSPQDRFDIFDTPAGKAKVLYLHIRHDFEHCVRALAYRCEPREIPPSMGAITVRGLINWERIRKHKEKYLSEGHFDWNSEFKRFTADKCNYLDNIILISSGYYSAVKPETIHLSADVWREKSIVIRTWHELTHFVCRGLYLNDIDAVRDEVFADMIGLIAAFNHYDTWLAKIFMGIEDSSYRRGGRLENYISDDQQIEKVAEYTREIIILLSRQKKRTNESNFDFLLRIFEEFRK